MKNRISLILAIVATMAILNTSCSSSRQVVNGSKQQVEAGKGVQEYAQYGDWSSLVSGGKVSIAISGGKSMSSSMQMKMVKGKYISISMRPLLGIEVARVYIADDEIVIIDRIHKVYVKEKASLLTSGVPVDVATLQDIMLGRPHVLGKGTFNASIAGDVELHQSGNDVYITPKTQYEGFTYRYAFDSNKDIKGLEVSIVGGQSVYMVNYNGVETSLAGKVATETSVNTEINGKSLMLDMTLKNLTWNTEFNDNFEIPSGYSQASGSAIIKALGGTIR